MNKNCNYKEILKLIIKSKIKNKRIVFLCIGSNRVIQDCFGAMVGQLLKNKYKIPYFVYGDLTTSVNATNLPTYYSLIKHKHTFDFVVVIDSSAYTDSDKNKITVVKSCSPAYLMYKDDYRLGDLCFLYKSIKITSEKSENNKQTFTEVLMWANVLAHSIASALNG